MPWLSNLMGWLFSPWRLCRMIGHARPQSWAFWRGQYTCPRCLRLAPGPRWLVGTFPGPSEAARKEARLSSFEIQAFVEAVGTPGSRIIPLPEDRGQPTVSNSVH